MTPLLSIVTINLNNCEGLERTLSSLQRIRHRKDCEFILVDGKSSDRSLDLASSFYNPSCILSEKDRGIYNAMNKGLRMSNGLYVLWLNSGDELCLSVDVNELLGYLASSLASAVVCDIDFRDPSTNAELPLLPLHYRLGDIIEHAYPHQATFFRRDKVLELRGYDESFQIAADRLLLLRIQMKGEPIAVVDKKVSVFYSGGISSVKDVYLEKCKILYMIGKMHVTAYCLKVIRYRLGAVKSFIAQALGFHQSYSFFGKRSHLD